MNEMLAMTAVLRASKTPAQGRSVGVLRSGRTVSARPTTTNSVPAASRQDTVSPSTGTAMIAVKMGVVLLMVEARATPIRLMLS